MKFVKQKAEIIEKPESKINNIANIARICYKSENKADDESNKRLIENLIKNKHSAMLEHEDYIFGVSYVFQEQFQKRISIIESYFGVKLFLLITQNTISGNIRAWRNFYKYCFLIPAELKYIGEDLDPFPIPIAFKDNIFFNDVFENQNVSLIKSDKPYYYIQDVPELSLIEKTDLSEKMDILAHYRISAKIICDRGISHEIVRHRNFSFAQESSRYVNYNKKGVEFIDYAEYNKLNNPMLNLLVSMNNEATTDMYNGIINNGYEPQLARAVLPHNLKTEIVVTGNIREWLHFFNLRLFERTGKAHPLIKELAKQLFDDFEDKTPISRNLICSWSKELWETENE